MTVSDLLARVRETGWDVLVTDAGQPFLRKTKHRGDKTCKWAAAVRDRRAEVIEFLTRPDPKFLELLQAWDPDEFREKREAARAVSAAGSAACGRVDGAGVPPAGVGCWVVGVDDTSRKKPRQSQVWVKPGDVPPAWATLWALEKDKTWTRFPGADHRRGDGE